jgi:hypothetical protein
VQLDARRGTPTTAPRQPWCLHRWPCNYAHVDGSERTTWAAPWTFLHIHGVVLAANLAVDGAEARMNRVGTDAELCDRGHRRQAGCLRDIVTVTFAAEGAAAPRHGRSVQTIEKTTRSDLSPTAQRATGLTHLSVIANIQAVQENS